MQALHLLSLQSLKAYNNIGVYYTASSYNEHNYFSDPHQRLNAEQTSKGKASIRSILWGQLKTVPISYNIIVSNKRMGVSNNMLG